MRITYPDSGNLSGCAHTLRIPPRGMRRQGHSKHTCTPDWRPSRGLRGLDTHTRTTGAAGVEGTGGPEGTGGLRGAAPNEVRPPSLAGGRGLRRPEHQRRHKHHKQEGRRRACGAWPRCRWAAAGPGRASRSTTPSRRLTCGDLTGGQPPTGTHSGPAHQGRPRGGRRSGGPPPTGTQSSHIETTQPQQAAPRAAAAQ